MDKKGVVRTVSGNTCTVYLYDEKRDVSVSINNVDPGEPVKQDKVCCHTSYIYIYIIYTVALIAVLKLHYLWGFFLSYHAVSCLYFQVKVIFGDDRERVGTLINIDDPDGIIKMDQTDQLKILPLKYLAKLGPTNI